MSKERLGSQGGDSSEPMFFYSTNEDIVTTFSQRKKRKQEKAAWKIFEKEIEADRIKSEESKEELEDEMIMRNFDDGLSKLKQELRSLKTEYFSVVPHFVNHITGDGEESIEVYSVEGTLIKKFVWLQGTSDGEPTDLWAEYGERCMEHEGEWKLLLEKIDRLRKRIKDIKKIQRGELIASEISETLSLTR